MVRILKKKFKTMPRRALASVLSISVFLSMILAVVSGVILVSLASNPTTVGALNHDCVVQQIDLLPVQVEDGSRTTLSAGTNGLKSYEYSSIIVNKDETVDFEITKDNYHNNKKDSSGKYTTTSFVEAFTLINQRINLAENPWLMTRWSGSGRVNGRIYFTVTKNGVEYGPGNVELSKTTYNASKGAYVTESLTDSDKNAYNMSKKTQQQLLTVNSDTSKYNVFSITLGNIINNNSAGYTYTNNTETDFNASSVQDFTVDFYEYLYTQVKNGEIALDFANFPLGDDWKDSNLNYVTIYMSCQIIASESGKPLTAGTKVHWEQFALGREVLDRPASMLPRNAEFMNITDKPISDGGVGVDYGRVSASTDGSVTFSNTSDATTGKPVVFTWNMRRYFNATELESLHLEATFTGMSASDIKIQNWFGGRTTTYVSSANGQDCRTKYNYRGVNESLQNLLADYARSNESTKDSIKAVIDFNKFVNWDALDDKGGSYPKEYYEFFPDDSLIYIDDIRLMLPAGAKITFTRFEFQVENEEIPATKANTAYPWYSTVTPDGLPPVGTPVYSTALNGATGRSYGWAVESAKSPVVSQKVDVLSMKTYSHMNWNEEDSIETATGSTDVNYSREPDGTSVYSSNDHAQNSYFLLMRWGYSKNSNDWERNYYTYLDVKSTPYLYYSYEIEREDEEDTTEPKAGFYFHFQNARHDRYSKTSNQSGYAYQYYLDHSGIALNQCSNVFALGANNDDREYGTKAILSTRTAMTGCIDISALHNSDVLLAEFSESNGTTNKTKNEQIAELKDKQKNSYNYLLLESLRVYVGPNTKIKINYFFFGGKSLDESNIGSVIPTDGGTSFPWATTKEQFDDQTDPTSSDAAVIYANKFDVLGNIQDRVALGNKSGFPGATVDSKTGAVTVTVDDPTVGDNYYNTQFLKMAGTGFDHVVNIPVAAEGDLTSIRYLHYSVKAMQGMRWSIMFCESNDSASQQRAFLTWCDAEGRWNDNNVKTAAPAGKAYMRIVGYNDPGIDSKFWDWDSPEYNNWWIDKNNSSWRIYSIPGSQTGCFDLQQVNSNFEWNNIVSIYLVAYRDPRLVFDSNETSSVTFNYVYLTSSAISTEAQNSAKETTNAAGRPASTVGTSYNWGGVEVSKPSIPSSTDASVVTKQDFLVGDEPVVTDDGETTSLDYYAGNSYNPLEFSSSEVTITENSSTVDWNYNQKQDQLVLSSTSKFRFKIAFKTPISFNMSKLNEMEFDINSDVPFKIAYKFHDGDEEAWVHQNYWTKMFSSNYNSTADRFKAGYYDKTVYFDTAVTASTFNKSKAKLTEIQILVDAKGSGEASKFLFNSSLIYDPKVNLVSTPYLYYSYRFIDKETGKTVTKSGDPLRVGMAIFERNTYYYFRNLGGLDSSDTFGKGSYKDDTNLNAYYGTNQGYGKPSFVRLSTGSGGGKLAFSKHYYTYGAETGCIDLSKYFVEHDSSVTLNRVRFYIDSTYYTDDYELVVDYLFLGAASSTTTTFKQKWDYTGSLAPKPADFRKHVVNTDTDVTDAGVKLSSALEVDLSKTPYLFYSICYNAGQKGTFGLKTDGSNSGPSTFYRDVGLRNGDLISATEPTQILQQSETGCIDVRSWYRKNGYTGNMLYITDLIIIGDDATINYMYFGPEADKTIDLLPSSARGTLDNGLPTRTWVVMSSDNSDDGTLGVSCEIMPLTDEDNNLVKPTVNEVDVWDPYDESTKGSSVPSTKVRYKGDLAGDSFNDVWIKNDSAWSQVYVRYGNIANKGARNTYKYCSTGNNQMSGLMVDLNETPYLHFSIDQPADSKMSLVLQLNDWTSLQSMNGKLANEVRPWLSGYCPTSSAGQLINIVASSPQILHYKDHMMKDITCDVAGNVGGVIDLRSWFTVTNGCENVISLDSLRFYTHSGGTDMKVNYCYLSSSSSAAYSVTFHKNDGTGEDGYGESYTQYVLQNANKQYVSDDAVEDYKKRQIKDENDKLVDTHIFVGWYTDPECENYFDIEGTPMTGNIDLYARWIDVDDIELMDENKQYYSEVSLLAAMSTDRMTISDEKTHVAFDNESLSIVNDGLDTATVTFEVNTAYSIERLRSLFLGFDTSRTCEGFDIILNAKSSTSREYALVQNSFKLDFLTDKNLLTAAPYDKELALYTYLGIRDDLPVRENKDSLIEIKSITFIVPAGVYSEIRYIKAGNEMSLMGNTDVRAPQSATDTFDLLANTNDDPAFIITGDDIIYNELKSKSLTLKGNEYTQASIHGREDGFVHLGGLYSYSIDMKKASNETKNDYDPGRWLYFSVDQKKDSHFTFALYASFDGVVESKTSGVRDLKVYDIHTTKSVSYFDASSNGLVAKDLDSNAVTYIPVESAYINGSMAYWIDLYSWYKDALKPYRSNSEVTSVKILGLRLYTDDRSTDTTINYMFIGGNETSDSTAHYDCWVEYPYNAGASKATWFQKGTDGKYLLDDNGNKIYRENVVSDPFQMLGYDCKGHTYYVSLDELTTLKDDASIDDPTKKFVGWVFRDYAKAAFVNKYQSQGMSEEDARAEAAKTKTDAELMPYLVYWNPNPTNGNMYEPGTNEGGSWSLTQVEGFVTNRKSIFYTFSTLHNCNTQIIIPIFADADYQPTIKVTKEGSGTVQMLSASATAVQDETPEWTAPFGDEIVVRASGTNFAGWYDQNGVLLSVSKDYHVTLSADTTLVAKFGSLKEDSMLEYLPQNGRTIVWLQSEHGTANTDFRLEALSGGEIYLQDNATNVFVQNSNINDLTSFKQIACYWNIADAQLLKAVAPNGYHWEQLLVDGSSIRVSDAEEYVFVASTNIKLVAKEGTGNFETAVIIDEFCFDDDRTDPYLRFNGQIICADDEEVITCGLVFTDYMDHGEKPSLNCGASETATATAWNSTTGQFVVEFSLEGSPEYAIRGYAIVYNSTTNQYIVRYSQCLATVF